MAEASYRRDIDLPNKPLVEAILELRWLLDDHAQPGTFVDPGFRILLARFYDRIQPEGFQSIDLPIAAVPEVLTSHVVRHQFRKASDTWPLFQLGPGILTVNETSSYTWDTYFPVAKSAIERLFASYPSESPLRPGDVRLRYLNALPFDPSKVDPLQFLSRYLHTQIDVDAEMFRNHDRVPRPESCRLHVRYPLEGLGAGEIHFSTGLRDNKPAILWENRIHLSGSDTPDTPEGLATWLEAAHTVAEDWFFALARGDLLESFERPE